MSFLPKEKEIFLLQNLAGDDNGTAATNRCLWREAEFREFSAQRKLLFRNGRESPVPRLSEVFYNASSSNSKRKLYGSEGKISERIQFR